jgi:hypothetical protein
MSTFGMGAIRLLLCPISIDEVELVLVSFFLDFFSLAASGVDNCEALSLVAATFVSFESKTASGFRRF